MKNIKGARAHMKTKLFISFTFILIVVALTVAVFYYRASRAPLPRSGISINGHVFAIEVADTFASRAQGLSGRSSLGENEGMLFVFSSFSSGYGFWMKDMKFPLDFVWINGDTIVGVTENARPEPGVGMFGLKTYYPPEPVNKVLELNAGLAKKIGLRIGDTVHVVQ